MPPILTMTFALCALGSWLSAREVDMYRIEPFRARACALVLGAVFFLGVSLLVESFLAHSALSRSPSWTSTALAAGQTAVAEDLAKLAAVLVVVLAFRKSFGNDPFDGITYGTLAGAGAAIAEFLLCIRAEDSRETQGLQLLISSLGHPIITGIGAAALGLIGVKTIHKRMSRALITTFILGWLVHASWNLFTFAEEDGLISAELAARAKAVVMISGMGLLRMMCRLALAVRLDFCPSPELQPIPRWASRSSFRWMRAAVGRWLGLPQDGKASELHRN
jgi:RsiW-degrading membrane proteinase PrsW (M82 family)